MRVLIIGNPIAGRGKARKRILTLSRLLRERGHTVDVYMTGKAGDARQRAGTIEPIYDRLVVAGGDGTLNEVVNGLVDPSALPIAQLPAGSANILACELSLPRKPAGVADVIESGVVRRLDLGHLENTLGKRRVLLLTSSGYDAIVTRIIASKRKGALGYIGYFFPILRSLTTYRAPRLVVTVDGKTARGAMVVASNIRNYGGIFSIADKASCDSGVFDVCVLHRGSIPALVSYAVSGLLRRMSRRRDITYLTGREVRIESPDSVPYEVDGDYAGEIPITLTVQPRVVPILTPAPRVVS